MSSDRLNHQYLKAIASHPTQTQRNNRVGINKLQKIADALNQKVEIKFSAIAP